MSQVQQLNFDNTLRAEPSIPTSAGLAWANTLLKSLCPRCNTERDPERKTLVSVGEWTSNPDTGRSGLLIVHKCTAKGCGWKEVI